MAQNQLTTWVVRHGFLAKAVLVALLVVVVLSTITVPFFTNATEINSKITIKKKESQELANKVSVLSGLDESVLDERVTVLDKALPPKKDVVLYLSTIDGLSRELNLNFGGISISPGEVTEASEAASKNKKVVVEQPGLHILETDIEFTGSKENIYSFLRLIEESAPLMQIKDARVNGLTEENFGLSLKLGMLYALTDVKQIKGPISLFDSTEEKYFQDLSAFRRYETLSNLSVQDTDLGKTDLFENTVTPQQ